ncbi:MAG TPA: methyltransferase domain-containing protein [Candidatus Caccomorpha excrementavium]|nr:methyltransferase domain-containing protein [Candidatus Caccomorpha excrementavium]
MGPGGGSSLERVPRRMRLLQTMRQPCSFVTDTESNTSNRSGYRHAGIRFCLMSGTVSFGSARSGSRYERNEDKCGKRNGYLVEYFYKAENDQAAAAEELEFPDHSFDVVTACQCFWYFNHELLEPKLFRMLKPGGSLLVLYMSWLPFEDEIAGASEALVLKYNPEWSGGGETMHPIEIPDCYSEGFELIYHEEYRVSVPFTRESWNGRLKACRGIGASLTEKEIAAWEQEHRKLLDQIAPPEFPVLHYGAMAELRKREAGRKA